MIISTNTILKKFNPEQGKVDYPYLKDYIFRCMFKIKTKIFISVFLLFLMMPPITTFAQSSSSNYRIEESYFGVGGELDASSPNYRAQQSAGENTIGNTSSTNYQANAGFNTTAQPYLEVATTGGNIDLGDLSSSSTSTATSTFYVRAYLASGYNVVIASQPPTNPSGHVLTNLLTQTAPSTGTEQFGINLRANTSPTTFGADPSQSPDSSFGYGYAAPGYDTPNVYRYIPGDVIARSDKSSGRTDYTISYMYNISGTTPAGTYDYTQDIVVVATY